MKIIPVDKANEWVRLAPINSKYIDGLIAAGSDESIWQHFPVKLVEADAMRARLEYYINEMDSGDWRAHVVIAPNGEIVGQTCYLNIRGYDCGVEIGGTWYNPKFHGSKINPAAKLLLLENAFECGAIRVDLKTDALNARSRAAILKLGAKFEGILRAHMKRANGTWRDTAYYSILADEWPEVRAKLLTRLNAS